MSKRYHSEQFTYIDDMSMTEEAPLPRTLPFSDVTLGKRCEMRKLNQVRHVVPPGLLAHLIGGVVLSDVLSKGALNLFIVQSSHQLFASECVPDINLITK